MRRPESPSKPNPSTLPPAVLAKSDLSKWQNRKPQTLFPDRDTNITTLYGPKSLWEASRNQLRGAVPKQM